MRAILKREGIPYWFYDNYPRYYNQLILFLYNNDYYSDAVSTDGKLSGRPNPLLIGPIKFVNNSHVITWHMNGRFTFKGQISTPIINEINYYSQLIHDLYR